MRLLHYIEIENFKCFGEKQRIELDHPTVLIGPNNCGKTSAIQALALWSQAVRTWYDVRKDSAAKERTSTPLNRLNIVAVPVTRTRLFWHNTHVRKRNKDIQFVLTVGLWLQGQEQKLPMRFRSQGDELVYCTPDESVISNLDLIAYAASLRVELLYPMSGLDTEEPILQPGRVDVLLGQGRTADVLRNLCLAVARSNANDWARITTLMQRLFRIQLGEPEETARGTITLSYSQEGVKELLDISSAGRGMLQMLLVFAYLYAHKKSVLLIDEPDAHLEILRQKQVYVLLRDIASENGSQVVMVTHSEVILDEAIDKNLTLLLDGRVDNLVKKRDDFIYILKHFGAEYYVRARERGYVLYVEGSTDVDMLRALAKNLQHPAHKPLDGRINSFYIQNSHPLQGAKAELERVEGGFGIGQGKHFNDLSGLLPDLRGLAILDDDGHSRTDRLEGALKICYWRRYEMENYFITPELLRDYAGKHKPQELDAASWRAAVDKALALTLLDGVFGGSQEDYETWADSPPDAARLIWETKTEKQKLSKHAVSFFKMLAEQTHTKMLLKKSDLHLLIPHAKLTVAAAAEVKEKLDLLAQLFEHARNYSKTLGSDDSRQD